MRNNEDPVVTVTVTRSAGEDCALLVMIDTYEHIGQNSRPLRILVNDHPVFADVEYAHDGEPMAEARDVTINVYESQIAYLVD